VYFKPIDLLYEVLQKQHANDELSFQLVPNLRKGCQKWLALNELAQIKGNESSLSRDEGDADS
jgi:hypothetical protein